VNTKSNLFRLAEVMDTLRSPGGCQWDAEQTHQSLLTYLLEETYEFIDAVERSDRNDMVEELGDVLLQVYFHSRIGEERNESPFSIEEVAKNICDKLIRRHPHVFSSVEQLTADEVEGNWEKLKSAEKSRKSPDEGVSLNQPALSLASKLLYRAEKHGHELSLDMRLASPAEVSDATIGDLLLAVVSLANKHGIDPEFALRGRARLLVNEMK
jgi:XTP/dITP diphosphohydrolase